MSSDGHDQSGATGGKDPVVSSTISDRFMIWWLRRGFRGFHRLRNLRRVLGGADRMRLQTPYGSVFDLDPVAYIDRIVLREGYYESEVLEALRPFLGDGAVFWDIGGNFGLHSITAKRLYPASKIFTFEPNPAMISEIDRNARLNGVAIGIVPCALAAANESRTLHVNDQGNAGMSTLHAWEGGHYDRQITVESCRADHLVATGRVPAPTVIKLDVEGGEADVLAGLGALLHDPRLGALVFEAAAGLEQAAANDPIAGPLRAAGFQFAPLARREKSSHPLENYLATRAR